jgi:hypothetical protein
MKKQASAATAVTASTKGRCRTKDVKRSWTAMAKPITMTMNCAVSWTPDSPVTHRLFQSASMA